MHFALLSLIKVTVFYTVECEFPVMHKTYAATWLIYMLKKVLGAKKKKTSLMKTSAALGRHDCISISSNAEQ